VLLGLGAEAQLVDVIDDLAQIVAARNLVLDLTEDLADFVFDRVRPRGLLLENVQIGERFEVDEVAEIVAGLGLVVIQLAEVIFGGGPGFPAIRWIEDEGVRLTVECGFVGFVLFEAVQVFQEEEPGGLLGVI
jgi:hypothetical protein